MSQRQLRHPVRSGATDGVGVAGLLSPWLTATVGAMVFIGGLALRSIHIRQSRTPPWPNVWMGALCYMIGSLLGVLAGLAVRVIH